MSSSMTIRICLDSFTTNYLRLVDIATAHFPDYNRIRSCSNHMSSGSAQNANEEVHLDSRADKANIDNINVAMSVISLDQL